MRKSSSAPAIAKTKAPSLSSINNIGITPTTQRTRESVVTLSYSGARSSSELALIESNLPKKRKLLHVLHITIEVFHMTNGHNLPAATK